MSDIAEIAKLYTTTMQVSWYRYSEIMGFRQMANLGVPAAARGTFQTTARFVGKFFTDPEYAHLRKDGVTTESVLESLKPVGGIEGFAQMMTDNQVKSFQKSVDAASLVFAHSVLDAAAMNYCRVTAMISPESWEPFMEKKQYALQDIKGANYDELLKRKIEEHLQALDYDPMMRKIDRLFQVCRPEPGFDPIRDYRYDPDRLEKLDQNRHDVVHKQILENPLPQGDDDIWFMLSTSNYLMALVKNRFDVKIDMNLFFPGMFQDGTNLRG